MPNACRSRELERGKRTSRTHRLHQGGISLAREASAAAKRRNTMATGTDEGVAAWRRFGRVARATGPWNMVHHCQPSTGLYPLSPCICATYLASACIPVPRNTRHTCPTQHPNYCHPQMASARAQITNNKYATCMAGPHACKSRKSGASAGLAVRVALLQASALRMVPLPHDNH